MGKVRKDILSAHEEITNWLMTPLAEAGFLEGQ